MAAPSAVRNPSSSNFSLVVANLTFCDRPLCANSGRSRIPFWVRSRPLITSKNTLATERNGGPPDKFADRNQRYRALSHQDQRRDAIGTAVYYLEKSRKITQGQIIARATRSNRSSDHPSTDATIAFLICRLAIGGAGSTTSSAIAVSFLSVSPK